MLRAVLGAALIVGVNASPAAQAAVFQYDHIVDVDSDLNPSGNSFYAILPNITQSLSVGDVVEGRIRFAGGKRLQLNDVGSSNELIYVQFGSLTGDSAVSETSFIGLAGDYFGPEPSPLSSQGAGVIVGANGNLTATGFSFTGLMFTFTIATGAFTPSQFAAFYIENAKVTAVNPVPEPATLGLLGLGVLALAARRRRS